MKIVHVITTLDVGGAEVHLLAQVRGQVERGHQVRVFYLKGQGSLAGEFRAAGAAAAERLALGPAFPWRLRQHAAWADIVHSHLLKADMATAAASWLGFGAKLVASKHNDEQVLLRAPVARIHGLLGNRPRRTIVLSEHVRAFIERHGRVRAEKLVRIYYGLDPTPFAAARARAGLERGPLRAELGFAPEDVVCICVARFAPQKRHDLLLAGFARARALEPRLKLLLVGDDPFGDGRARAEAQARALELGSTCVFAGIRRDVPRLLAASELFVMTSAWEGLGLVFLEAMASGLPVLATRVSAVPEVVRDGKTGLLVPLDDLEALSAALVRLAREPELGRILGQQGVEDVRTRFGLERMVEETLAVYRAVCGGRP